MADRHLRRVGKDGPCPDHLASPAVAGFSVSKIRGQGPDTDVWGLTAYCPPEQLRPYAWAQLDALATEHGTDFDGWGHFRGTVDQLGHMAAHSG